MARREARLAIEGLSLGQAEEGSQAVCRLILESAAWQKAGQAMLYMPISGEIDVKSFFMKNNYTYPTFKVELISYISTILDYEIKLVDHDKYEWVKIQQLIEYDFLDGDKPIINTIIEEGETKMFQIYQSVTVE